MDRHSTGHHSEALSSGENAFIAPLPLSLSPIRFLTLEIETDQRPDKNFRQGFTEALATAEAGGQKLEQVP